MATNFKSIDRDSIEEIDVGGLDDVGRRLVNIQSNHKILMLKNCDNLGAIVNQLEPFRNWQNTRIFVIIVRMSVTYNHTELRHLRDKIAKPFILQIEHDDSNRLFFTNTKDKLEELKIDESRNVGTFKYFHFDFVCNLLHSEREKFGKYNFNLLKMEMETNACFKGKRLIDLAVEHADVLVPMFLQLFNPDIEAFNNKKERILEITVVKGNSKLLKVVLEIPVEAENLKAHLSSDKHHALSLMTEKDLSLLMLAALSGRNDVIVFLLNCGLNVNELNDKDQTACDFAWDNGHRDSVIELLKADSPFPYEFDLSQLPIDSELLKISHERDLLHEQIRSNQLDDVKTFIKENPKIRCFYDKRNQCVLVTALESKNFEIYSFLRSKGFTSGIDEDHKKILSQMMKNNTYHELLEADSPFPYEFDLSQLPTDSELLKINEERDLLHEQIRCNQLEPVKTFVVQNPKLKCAYDNRNQCALVTALKSKNFEIYSFLRSKGFIPGIDGDHKKILSELRTTEKDELKFSNRKYFPSNENSHIMDLLSRSRLGFGNEQKNFENVQKYYEMLDEIPEVQPMLQVISLASKLDIVFDFNQKGVGDMDPSQDLKHTVVKGRTIYDNGTILIGGNSSEAEVLATMAHEFTHYAMHLLYDNQGHPYHVLDNIRKQKFTEIVDFCKTSQSKNPVIENVFTYPREEHALELIVRVPHLLALHWKEKDAIGQVRQDFEKLFTFFSERVLSDCTREIPLIKAKQRIRDLNNLLDLKRETEKSKLFCDIENIDFDEIMKSPQNILIRSTTPELILCNLLNYFKNMGTIDVVSLHIFIKREQLMDPKLGQIIRDAFESTLQPRLIVLETETLLEFDKIKEFYSFPTMQSRIVSIMKSLLTKKTDEENFGKVFPIQHQIEYTWNDLSEMSKAKILSSKVQFQGLEMALKDVLSVDSKILSELPLEDIFKLSEMRLKTFNESVPSSPEIYITRTFADQAAETLTTENVIELLMSEKSLILADDSGMGKTTSALYFSRKLKQRSPHSWVVYIDLKQYTESYYKDDEGAPLDDITPDFFSSKILKLRNRVEMKFFEHFYRNGKVVFVIDGFDEISPIYKNCILDVVNIIHESKNLLFVTTRTHLTEVLEKRVSSRVIKLQHFRKDDQVKLLVKLWTRNNKNEFLTKNRSILRKTQEIKTREDDNEITHANFWSRNYEEEFETKARSLLGNFSQIMIQQDFFGVPLHVRMLGEIYEKSVPSEREIRELNIFSLYHTFITKKTEIWVEKGPMANKDSASLQTSSLSLNITIIHQKLAIENFFSQESVEALELPEIEEPLTSELLARIGLLQVEVTGKFLFKHQSFTEYFVADFVLSRVAKKTGLAKSDELHGMFLEILHGDDFGNVRSFINGKLEMKENLNVDILSAKLEKSFELESNRKLVRNLVKENLSALLTFMLQTVKISEACKLSLINQKGKLSDQPLHFAVRFSTLGLFKRLWSCIESFSEKDELIALFFSAGFHNINVLNRAIIERNNEALKEILRIASELMDSGSFKRLLLQEGNHKQNALIYASRGSSRAFDIVWKAVESKLEAEDQKELLISRESAKRHVLLLAVFIGCAKGGKESQKVIHSILRISKKLFSYEEMREFLFTEDCAYDNALHCAVRFGDLKIFTILWSFIKDCLNKADQRTLWLQKSDQNIFTKSLQFGKTIAKEVIAASREILNPGELRKVLTEKGFLNHTFISKAVEMAVIDNIFDSEAFEWIEEEYDDYRLSVSTRVEKFESNPLIQDLSRVDFFRTKMKTEELRAALYAEVESGCTILHFALENGSSLLVDRLFQLAGSMFDRSERQEFIRAINLSSLKNVEKMDSVCSFLLQQSDLVTDVKDVFLTLDDLGWNFVTSAAFLNKSCFLVVLEWFKENFSHKDLRQLFFGHLLVNCSDVLPQVVAERCDEEITRKFFEFCWSTFDPEELKEILLILDYDDHNTLGASLSNQISAVVSEVWSFYARVLNETELKELLFKSSQGRFYFLKEDSKNPQAIETLKAIVIARYGKDKTRQLFR